MVNVLRKRGLVYFNCIMTKLLLFILDISGFTHFVQTTEVGHSQHVIAELLRCLFLRIPHQ